MMMDPIAGFLLGLAGSMHCAGMCGPIALALPRGKSGSVGLIVGRTAYNGGRILTYATMGAIIGIGGNAIVLSGYGRDLSIAAGIVMIIMAVAQIVLHRTMATPAWLLRLMAPLRSRLGNMLRTGSTTALFGIGVLNGMLPCGMVTAALIGAAGTGHMLQSALFMSAFGLGTTPMMAAIALGAPLATVRARTMFKTAAPVIALVMGCIILVRGMGLGIPYLSPDEPSSPNATSCCSEH